MAISRGTSRHCVTVHRRCGEHAGLDAALTDEREIEGAYELAHRISEFFLCAISVDEASTDGD